MFKTLAIVPAYNESKTIEAVLGGVSANVHDILVVDDNSSDNTLTLAKKHNIKTIEHTKNFGKGKAIQEGFSYAVKKKYDAVIILDADLEHDPLKIPDFLEQLKKYDIVVGQRNQYRSSLRHGLNKWTTSWFKLVIPFLDDFWCGYRAIKIDLVKKMQLTSNGFEIELEMLLESVKYNSKIGRIHITTKPIKKTHFKFRDYIRSNNFFDRWIIKNNKFLKPGKLKKALLLISARIGLLIGGFFEKIIK
jgi:glycosyltransferase involved in cell wall biosynthesis